MSMNAANRSFRGGFPDGNRELRRPAPGAPVIVAQTLARVTVHAPPNASHPA